MRFAYRRVLSAAVITLTGLSVGVSWQTPVRAQAQATERLPGFEVASVKQNTSGDSRAPMRTLPGGRFVATNVLPKFLIAAAFEMINPESLIDVRILNGPDWIGSERYDINAKGNTEFRPSPDGPSSELLLMIRSLLEDRFKLKAHRETRELPIYELVVARADRRLGPELRQSSSACDAAIAAGVPPPRQPGEPPPCGLMGGPARTIAGGATMQQVAASLSVRLERIVVDKTGLTGRYAFNLAWTPEQMPAGAPPAGVPPIDPNGPSLFTALQEQLGLKLQSAKGPVDVLIIDHVEHPTAD